MARRVHVESLHVADLVSVAILEQVIELRPVALELGAFVEDLPEGVLHDHDLRTDPDLAARLLPDIRRGGQMVGVNTPATTSASQNRTPEPSALGPKPRTARPQR